MHKTKMEHDKIECLLDQFAAWASEETAHGKECVNTQEMGAVVDMIKDLAEAKEKLWKACYYKEIVEAMDEYEEDEEEKEFIEHILRKMEHGEQLTDHERMGYDRWRYSSGRYAPKGRGRRTRMGFTPDPKPWPTTVSPYMGVDGDGMGTYGDTYGMPLDKYGREPSYERYKRARKYYTETRTPEAKTEMSEQAMHHVKESVDTMREIWADADPDLKKKMKADLTSLMNEMM